MDRERITISIRKNVLGLIDRTIDGVKVRNRSHAIESLVMQSIGTSAPNHAVILLGGDQAIESIPATKNFLLKLKAANFEEVDIAVGFLGDKVKEKLGDGSSFGLTLRYTDKGEGSGGAIKKLERGLTSTFVVFNSSKIQEIDLGKAIDRHKKYGAIATIITDSIKEMDGIYIFEPDIFSHIPAGFSMIEEDVIPKLLKAGEAIVLPSFLGQ